MPRHRLRLIVGAIFTIALLAWALHGISLSALARDLRAVRAEWLVLGLATLLASLAARAWRWGTLLTPQGNPASFGARHTAIYIGYGVSCVMPAGIGELARAAALKRRSGLRFGTVLGSICAERLLDVMVVFLLLFAPLVSGGLTGSHAFRLGEIPLGWIGLVLAVVCVVVLGAALWPELVARLAGSLSRVVGFRRLAPQIEAATSSLLNGIQVLRRPWITLRALLQSFVIWGLTAVTYWSGMQAFGITGPGFGGALFVQSVVAFAIALPSAPGYFGPFEAAVRLALSTYGIAPDVAIAYGLGIHLLAYLTVAVIGLPLAVRWGLSWRKIPAATLAELPVPTGETGAGVRRNGTVVLAEAPRVEVRDLAAGTREDRLAAAYLHAALMPASPVVRLGTEFMAEFYYRHLVRDGLIGCRIAWVDGCPAGFIAFTAQPHDFMPIGMRRHFPALVRVVSGALLERPARVATVARALRILKLRRDDLAAGPTYDAEVLSLGVLPQYRTPDFVRRTGVRLAAHLFEDATKELRAAGRGTIAVLIEVRDRATSLFLHSVGFRMQREWLGGVDCFTALYDAADPTRRREPAQDVAMV